MVGRDLELGVGERLRRFREGVEEAESREVLGFMGWSGVETQLSTKVETQLSTKM